MNDRDRDHPNTFHPNEIAVSVCPVHDVVALKIDGQIVLSISGTCWNGLVQTIVDTAPFVESDRAKAGLPPGPEFIPDKILQTRKGELH